MRRAALMLKAFNQLISPNGESFPLYRNFTLHKFKSYSCNAKWLFKTRESLDMKWSLRPRTIWGWGLKIRLNSPPTNVTRSKFNEEFRNIK